MQCHSRWLDGAMRKNVALPLDPASWSKVTNCKRKEGMVTAAVNTALMNTKQYRELLQAPVAVLRIDTKSPPNENYTESERGGNVCQF